MTPTLAMCNIFPDVDAIKAFAVDNHFRGIDWSFELEDLPERPMEVSRWVREQAKLSLFEVRYHCPFYQLDLGHDDPERAEEAAAVFRHIIGLVSKAGGRYLSMHIGLGLDSTEPLSWERTLKNMRRLVQLGAEHRVRVCLENLAWGWTSKPNLFEKLIRLSGAGVTFDFGHAHVCESIKSQQYSVEDFVTPHADRLFNAHVYHTEIPGTGHIPPDTLEQIRDRLALIHSVGCPWWVIEIKEPEGLIKTREVVREYLAGCEHGLPAVTEKDA
ncbi:MAG: TIM barrel protein [Deltaproteobacteria bacterium]|jgi:sugar phosphate isomerase/epimerase